MAAFNSDAMTTLSIYGFVGLIHERLNKTTEQIALGISNLDWSSYTFLQNQKNAFRIQVSQNPYAKIQALLPSHS